MKMTPDIEKKLGRKNVIRVGDTVEIINPAIITRIGYEYTYEDACKEALETYKDDIYALLKKAKITGYNKLSIKGNSAWEKAERKIVGALAYDLVRKKIKTGNERKVYTEIKEDLKNAQVTVLSKRTTRTGTYYPAVCSEPGPWGGDYDYEPGGLENSQTHVILEIDSIHKLRLGPIRIEQCNVKKLTTK